MQHKMKSFFNRTLHGLPLVLTAILLSVIMYSLVEPGNPLAALGTEAFFAPNAVTLTATKTDALFNDVDGDSNADPGDTLQYTIVVANSGDTDATGTTLTDPTDDTELTIVAGSLRATPIGRNDTYSVLGNTHITHPVGTGVLANDLDPDGGTFTASCAPCTTANGGTVTLNANGSFTYGPPAGFTGADTFTYTVTDNHGLTDTGTVTFNVTNRIWWVDSSAAGAGTGTSLDPFQALASAQTASVINDTIFIYNRGANYTAGFVLKDNQKLCGQGSDLAVCSGLTAPAGTTFPTTTTNPTIVNASGHVVTLAQNNTINGVTLGNSGAAANFALFGNNFGTLSLQVVTINTNNGAISLATGTATASFTSTTSAGGTNNVTLTSVNGNISLGSGALTGASGNAVNIAGGTAAFSTSTVITNSSAKAVNIQSKTGGTASFSGSINSTSGGTGITLLNNTGATFTFAGGMTLDTGTNTAFSATGGGTVSVMTSIHTANTTTATAVNIQNMTIGVGNILFRSISSNGGANPGLILNNLTGGTFTVVGTGPDGSGGTIQNKTGDAIQLTSVTGVSLNHMNITNVDGNGIAATSVANLGVNNSNFTDIADTLTPDEAALLLTNLAGTNSFSNSTITNALDDQIFINQSGATSLALFTINNNIFTGHDGDNDAIRYQGIGTTNGTVVITGNTFTNSDGDFIQATLEGSANLNLTVGGAGGSANSFTNTGAFTPLAGGITLSPGGGAGWNGRLDFDINNNTISSSNAQGVNINLLKPATSGATIDGFVRNNTISNTNNGFGGSIQVTNGGLVSQVTVEISGNTITGDKGTAGILVIGDQGGTVSTGARTDIRVLNNSVSAPSSLNTNAIHLNSSTTSANTGTVVCWDMQNNTLAGGGFSGTDTRIRQRFSAQVLLPSYAGGSTDTVAVQTYITGRGNSGVVSAATQSPGGYFNGACNAPTLAQMEAAYIEIARLQAAPAPLAPPPSIDPIAQPTADTGDAPSVNVTPASDSEASTGTEAQAPEAPAATTTVGPFTLPAGEQTTITFQATVNAPFPAANNPICNQATISGSNFSSVLTDDPDVAGTANPTCTTVQINADLAITKTDGATTEIPGTSVTYTIVASNDGPNDDPAAIVADTFPASITGVTWTCVGAGGGTCTASGSGNINETVNLPVGGSVTFTASGTISPSATGTLVNTATVATSTGITDPDPANNSATDSDTLTPQADLSITKTDGVTTATPGGSVTYTITASNAGPSNAPSVTVADTFPAILTANWTCVGAGGGTCTAAGSGNINDTANLPAGASVTYTVNATISASATGTLSNTATVSSGVTDPDPANNSATDTDTLTPQADLSITKTDGVTTATPGGSVTYTITASNAGPSNAPSVTVADTFPAILTANWTCVGAGGGTCTASGSGNINDTVNLPAGGSVTFTVNATIAASATGTLSNTATVSSGVTDPDPANNSATDTDTLTPQADLSITKTDGVTTATPGGSVTYTITASNAGPSDAPSVTVADTFPAILTANWTCVGAGGGTCTASGSGNINDTVNLPVGGSVTFTASATIAPSATGTLSNTATVSGGVTDPDPANNSATDTDTLTPQADLSITKTDGQTSDAPGTSLTYTIVASNAGPSNASSVTVADTLPASLTGATWTCVGAGGGTCTANGSGNLNDTVNLPVGASVTYTINATIFASATGTLSNTATVSSGVTDPNPGNNSATDTTTLIAQADLTITKADSAEPVPPGSPLTYTLSITNTGPSTALNVLVTDTLPAEVTWTGDTCLAGPPTGQTLVWSVGTLASGSGLSCEVYVTVNSAGGGVITNTAVIGSDVLDPTPANNTATEPTITNVPPTLTNVAITSPLNENGTATLTGNITDPDTGDTFTLVVDWGDGSAPQTFNYAAGTTAFSETHQYLDDNPTGTASDNTTVSLALSDSATNTDTDSTTVTVNNLAPTLSNIAVTSPINENGTATLTGNLADTGTLDSFMLVVDWGDGSAPETFNYPAGTTAFSESHTYTDDNPTGNTSNNYTIGLTLTDDDTGSDTDSTSVTVNNIGPVLSNVAATATNENGSTTLTGTITDPGTGDTFTLVVDWGDGSAPQTFNYPAGTSSFSETHPYLDDNPTATASDNYTIGLTLTDDDTGSDTDSTTVTVNNVAPALSTLAATATNENGTTTLTGTITDPGTGDTFTLVVDWGDGSAPQTFTYTAGTTAFSETHPYLDDNPTSTASDNYTIGLTLTDDDTGSDADSTSATVNNLAPTLSNVAITGPVDEGGTATLTGNLADTGTLDSFTLVVDWGDGSTPESFTYAAGSTAFSETHAYADDNPTGTASDPVTVNLTLTDDDTGSDTDTANLTVNNVAPTLSNLAATATNENGSTTLTGNITDPGTGDTFTLLVDWGDGSAPQTFNYPAGTTAFSETHPYLDDNPTGTASDNYTIGLSLTDDDTGSDTDSTSVTVNNVAPTLSTLAATATNEDGTTTLTGTITDPGTGDTFTLLVDWGDGSTPESFTYAAGTTAFSETHPYLDDNPTGTASDNYTIGLTLTDDDTGSDTNSTSVTVNNLAPTLSNVAITGPVDEGGTATLTGNLADTGTLDSFTLVVDWGDGSAPQSFTYAAGTTSFSETHAYADDDPTGTVSDPVTVNLTLTDDDTGSDTDTANLTVNNVAPTLSNIAITSPVNEGGTATLTGTITDPGAGDTFALVVDWGDGSAPETFNYLAGTTTFTETHVYADDDPTGTTSDSYPINLTLTDDDTGSDTDSTSITVNNVAPSLIISYPVADVDENAPFTVGGQIADPGVTDTFTFVAAWADGAVVTYTYPAGTTVFTVTHVYADDNPTGTPADPYSPSFTLTDDDTGSVTETPATPVTVHNVAPGLSNLLATSVNENGLSTLTGTITEASAQDSFALTVAWGDGSAFTYTYPAGTTVFTETHSYLDDNPTGTPADAYSVTLTLTDDDTGMGTGTTPLTVTNLAPALSQLSVAPVDENNLATLSGFITDTGTLDDFTLLINWGDGMTETFSYPAGTGAFTETHTYLDGLLTPQLTNYTITLTLTDDDTGQDTETIVITVNNIAPTITTLAATSPVDENGTTTLTGTFFDPGSEDTFTVVVDWGDGNVLTATYPAGAFDFQHTHQYLDDDPTGTPSDPYSITVTLSDDEGGTDTAGTALIVQNLSPVVAIGPDQSVADTAPTSFTGVFTDVGTLDTHTVLWDFGDGVTMTGTLTPTHTFPAPNTYTVTLTVLDDDTGQGSDTLLVTVLPATDLSLTKQAPPGPVLSGSTLVYTLTVSNLGPSEANGVTLTDTLPTGVTFASASSGCAETSGVVTCSMGVLPNGDSTSVQILVTVDLDYEGTLLNTAQVGSLSADPDPTNNTASATLEAVQTLIVFEDDFEDPPIQDEWGCTNPVTSTTPIGDRNFLGEFGPETVCLALTDLPEHAYVNVAFDLFIIRSWDGNQVEIPPAYQYLGTDPIVGPDVWQFKAEDVTLLESTFTNWVGQRQAYPGGIPDGDYPAWAGAVEIATLGYMYYDLPQDSVYHMEFTFAHTGSTLDLEFISQQLQDVFDESWGLDNVIVAISMTDSFGETYTIYLPIILR